MATVFFGMNVSLDGYVDHMAFQPDAVLFRHFIDQTRQLAGCVYGRRLYEIMRYWDTTDPDWLPEHRAFAEAWRGLHKWVVSGTLREVGPNATLVSGDAAALVRRLKGERTGEIEVGGTRLAQALGAAGLIDLYHLYLHPVVLGSGTPFFAGLRPPLRLLAADRIGGAVIRLSYAPA